jgi:hypothetical protein
VSLPPLRDLSSTPPLPCAPSSSSSSCPPPSPQIVGEFNLAAYDEDGHTRPLTEVDLGSSARRCSRPASNAGDVPWVRASWALSRDAEAAIDASRVALGTLSDSLDLQVVSFSQVRRDGDTGGCRNA